MRSLLKDSARKATDHGAVHENTSLVRWEKEEEEEEEEEKEESMIYRGCELRCIAEIRVESDNHSSEWYIEAWPREENEDEARGLNDDTKIDISFSPIFLTPCETVRHSITPPILSDEWIIKIGRVRRTQNAKWSPMKFSSGRRFSAI